MSLLPFLAALTRRSRIRLAARRYANRNDELETCPMGRGLRIGELTAVRMRTCLSDRKTKTGSGLARIGSAAESLEELRYELSRHALSSILDRQTKMPVVRGGRDDHRRPPVAERVHDQVRHDEVER